MRPLPHGYGSGVPVHDAPVAVDDEGLRHAVDAELAGDLALGVVAALDEGVAVPGKPLDRVDALVLVVESVDPDLVGHGDEERELGEARRAPARPHIEEDGLSSELVGSELATGSEDLGQDELRKRLGRPGGCGMAWLRSDSHDEERRRGIRTTKAARSGGTAVGAKDAAPDL